VDPRLLRLLQTVPSETPIHRRMPIPLGIGPAGFNTVQWLLQVPGAALTFAGVTGSCPGYLLFRKIGFKGPMPGKEV
jgi:hypothetical protein